MSTIADAQSLAAKLAVKGYDFDPDDSVAADVAWVDLKDHESFMVVAIRTVGTGDVDGFKILGNPQSDGSGTDVTVKTHAFANGQPNAVGDQVVLECNASELQGSRYVSASLELATSTDEFVVVYVRGDGLGKLDQTADSIA